MMIEMKLQEHDRYLVATLATARFNRHELHKTTSKSLNMLHPFVKDVESIAAEVVVARYLGVDFDTSNEKPRDWDLISQNGSKIEVKSSTNKNCGLRVKQYKMSKEIDIFILVTGVFPNYIIRGYAKPDDLFQDKWLKTMPDGNIVFELPQSELRSL